MAEAYLIEGAVIQDPEDSEGYLIEGAVFQAGAAPAGGTWPQGPLTRPLSGPFRGPI
jgi:hypothetical protein